MAGGSGAMFILETMRKYPLQCRSQRDQRFLRGCKGYSNNRFRLLFWDEEEGEKGSVREEEGGSVDLTICSCSNFCSVMASLGLPPGNMRTELCRFAVSSGTVMVLLG